MAALDRRLKRGEQSMRMLTDVVEGADRLTSGIMRALGCRAAPKTSKSAAGDVPAPPAAASGPSA
jgi:hypothetical protein